MIDEREVHEPVWMDTVIAALLRGGVLLSMSVVLLGLVFTFVHHPEYMTSRAELGHLTERAAVYPHSVPAVVLQVRAWRGQGTIMLGLLLLIATPFARVLFSIVAFAIERDRLYVAITVTVLALLVASFVLGAT
jgi:uncharacterized membrane protein